MSDRLPFPFPGLEGRRVEQVATEPEIPPSPKTEECQIELRPDYRIPDFQIERFTVTKFDQAKDLIEGTIEGVNTSIDRPFLVCWKGKKSGEGDDEERGMLPQYPIFFVDDKPVLTLSEEFDNIALVLALACWFSLEDRTTDQLIAPTLSMAREAILDMSQADLFQ